MVGDDFFGLGKPNPTTVKRKRRLNPADKKRIAAKQKWICKKCEKPLPARFHLDHIKPIEEGGSDQESNLQVLCPNCHAEKTEEERHRKTQKKIREAEKEEKEQAKRAANPLGFGSVDLLGGTTRGSRSKNDDLFGLGDSKKQGKSKKKDELDFGL